jgi:hypothetical protein
VAIDGHPLGRFDDESLVAEARQTRYAAQMVGVARNETRRGKLLAGLFSEGFQIESSF